MDRDEDVRLTTRHFDLLIACAVAWQMRAFATKSYRRGSVQSDVNQGQQTQDFDVY
jgi:hypothetical protein